MNNLFLKFCVCICLPLFCAGCSSSEKLSENEFLIEGKISNVEDGAVITLFRNDGDFGMSIATDTVKSGRFVFKNEAVANPEKMSIMCFSEGYPSSRSLDVWVASGKKIRIMGKDKLLPAWEVKSAVSYQKTENVYANKIRNTTREIMVLDIEMDSLRAKARAASSQEEGLIFKKGVDSLALVKDSLKLVCVFAEIGIMEKMETSAIWLDKLRGISMTLAYTNMSDENASTLRKKAEELYVRMSEEERHSPEGYKITANLFPPPVAEVGDDMVDTDLFDPDGKTTHLSAYLGKYLLLDFWSRGCGPCIMALPEMKEVAEIYKEKLIIISISLDTDKVWKDAMLAHDTPWVNLRDHKGFGGLAAHYGVRGIPNYIMISPEGKIVDKWMGFGTGYIKMKVGESIK